MPGQEQMNDLIDKVHQWGVDRKIIGNGKLETQWLKLLSEFGEMCDTLAKGGDPIDDIGDQLVVLIMMAGIADDDVAMGALAATGNDRQQRYFSEAIQGLCESYSCLLRYFTRTMVKECVAHLKDVAAFQRLTLLQCLEHSYSQIKDRKGYLNEQGVFIKE